MTSSPGSATTLSEVVMPPWAPRVSMMSAGSKLIPSSRVSPAAAASWAPGSMPLYAYQVLSLGSAQRWSVATYWADASSWGLPAAKSQTSGSPNTWAISGSMINRKNPICTWSRAWACPASAVSVM